MILEFLIYFFVFAIGVSAGSFLNCVVFRLEHKENLKGRSFCPRCRHQLSWRDLFPVVSFLFLKGKCRYCKEEISLQYPLSELATGIIFVAIFNAYFSGTFFNAELLFYMLLSCFLIAIFIYDLKYYIIPDKILFPAIAIAFAYRIFDFHSFINYILAALIASGFFFVIFAFSGGKWMGFGDVKLAILMGLLLGLPNVLAALFLAFFFGAIIGVILIVFKEKKVKSEIPFGPFLITGTILAVLWGSGMVEWYLSFSRII